MLLLSIIISGFYYSFSYYFSNTKEIPSHKGEYIEGIVGQPRFINPILSQTNDVDSDLSALIYSGLLKFNEKGELENDIAEKYEIEVDSLTYVFYIKKGIKWHDGKELTADDIMYTIQTIQSPDFNSPLRTNWKGIRAEKVDDYTIKFILKTPYSPFLNNLTFGILPKHKWEFIGARNFPLAEYNLKPIGTGPYKFEQFIKDKDGKISRIKLSANENYYQKKPLIEKITFVFFKTEEEAISAFNRKETMGINYLSPKNKRKVVDFENSNVHRINIPRYFAAFLNQTKSKALSDKNVRIALSHATDKNFLVSEIFSGEGSVVETPIPKQLLGYNSDVKTYQYSQETAKDILEKAGWVDSDNDGIREKDGVELELNIVSTDWPDLVQTSKALKDMWEGIGAKVEIKNVEITKLKNEYIKPREYEILIFGEILNYDPDPFVFWHSSQKKDVGLNLSMYDNSDADNLLEEARMETDRIVREEKYRKFQEIVAEDIPAVFLYSPNYIYIQNKSVQGTDIENIVIPSNRFNGIENWYVKTERVWK